MNCYLCHSNHFRIIANKNQMRFGCFGYDKYIVECLGCNLIQLIPQWNDEELELIYKGYWEKEDFSGQKRKIRVSRYLMKNISPRDKILEVGCGHGDNLKFLSGNGFDVCGIDRIRLKEEVIEANIERYILGEKYDFIYAIHLFEHLKDPRKFISWILDNLKNGGRFILEMPSIEDPLLKLYRNEKFGRFYWYPYHFFFFGLKTVTKLMQEFNDLINFKVSRKQEYGILNHLRWSILGRPGNNNRHIFLADTLYKLSLNQAGYGDTLIIQGALKQ